MILPTRQEPIRIPIPPPGQPLNRRRREAGRPQTLERPVRLGVRVQKEQIVPALKPPRDGQRAGHEVEDVAIDGGTPAGHEHDLRLATAAVAREQDRRDATADAPDRASAMHSQAAGVHDAGKALAVHDLADEIPLAEILDFERPVPPRHVRAFRARDASLDDFDHLPPVPRDALAAQRDRSSVERMDDFVRPVLSGSDQHQPSHVAEGRSGYAIDHRERRNRPRLDDAVVVALAVELEERAVERPGRRREKSRGGRERADQQDGDPAHPPPHELRRREVADEERVVAMRGLRHEATPSEAKRTAARASPVDAVEDPRRPGCRRGASRTSGSSP